MENLGKDGMTVEIFALQGRVGSAKVGCSPVLGLELMARGPGAPGLPRAGLGQASGETPRGERNAPGCGVGSG